MGSEGSSINSNSLYIGNQKKIYLRPQAPFPEHVCFSLRRAWFILFSGLLILLPICQFLTVHHKTIHHNTCHKNTTHYTRIHHITLYHKNTTRHKSTSANNMSHNTTSHKYITLKRSRLDENVRRSV